MKRRLYEMCPMVQLIACRTKPASKMVAGRRVAHQGTVHLAGYHLVPVAGRTHLVDSTVRAVVLVEVKGSTTQ